MLSFLAYLTWDPNRNFFIIPGINHPVTWYGLFFALGFLGGYFVIRKIFFHFVFFQEHSTKELAKQKAVTLADRLSFLSIIGGLAGARIGHILFYDWPYYKMYPSSMMKIWEGGLASHGGAIGILLALILFVRWARTQIKALTFLATLDGLVVATAFAAGCIRIGNFINQEILGMPTSVPWGVIFLHPLEGVAGIPLHPVQLYESISYFLIFFFLLFLWKKKEKKLGDGLLTACFFILLFGSRFFFEFLKFPQSHLIDETGFLKMGQWLSLPFVAVGIILFIVYRLRRIKPSPS